MDGMTTNEPLWAEGAAGGPRPSYAQEVRLRQIVSNTKGPIGRP